MRIVVDAFGGDNAPLAVISGCKMAADEYGYDIILTGDENVIRNTAAKENIDISKMRIVHAPTVIPVCEEPSKIRNEYADCSMATAFKLLNKGEADAAVSAGSTGAIVMGASLLVKRIKGIKRAALAPIMPMEKGHYILLDVGANIECRPDMLLQFAIMGSIYMNKIMKIDNPRVALVNIGEEETKGRETDIESYKLLKSFSGINFTGNIEPRYIPLNGADVVVTDGFTGNVVLKLTEGMGKLISNVLKDMFGGVIGKLAALPVYGKIKSFKKQMDYKEVGGAPLLGTAKPVIKAHGSSDAKAFKNAIHQAANFVEQDVIGEITKSISTISENNNEL